MHSGRVSLEHLRVVLNDSRHAHRMPGGEGSGEAAVLDTFHHETLTEFYEEWYRPDLMAVIAVGDFDGSEIQRLIEEHFSRVSARENAPQRPVFEVPPHEGTLFSIIADPELPFSTVEIDLKRNRRQRETVGDFRRDLVDGLYADMLNQRLSEAAQQPDAPFLFAAYFDVGVLASVELQVFIAATESGETEAGFEALLTEAERVKRFGFTTAELERQKKELLSAIESAFDERANTPSADFAAELVEHFASGQPFAGIVYIHELTQSLVPGISPGDAHMAALDWLVDDNRVVAISSPESQDIEVPSVEDLLKVIEAVPSKEIEAIEEEFTDLPLLESSPVPGEIVTEEEIPEIGVTVWQLSNGVRVVLKPTDFKNDEILMSAFSPGGHSLVADEDFASADMATSVVQQSGVGLFDQIDLDRKLAGQDVFVSPWIGPLAEGMSGFASPDDQETMLQLVYLYFSEPRRDEAAFGVLLSQIEGFFENFGLLPAQAFEDTILVTMAQNHPRARPFSPELLREVDLDTSLRIYRDRFADAGDFTFLFVGALDLEALRPLVQTYLGGLTSIGREESWTDVGIRPPRGVIEKFVFKGVEERSQTRIIFSGDFEWSAENQLDLSALDRLMTIRLFESLRSDLGEVYTPFSWVTWSRFPEPMYEMNISFESEPEATERLAHAVFALIDSLQRFGPAQEDLVKVTEQERFDYEAQLETNEFWSEALFEAFFNDEDPTGILQYDELVDDLTVERLQAAAQRYLNTSNYARFVLFPEGYTVVEESRDAEVFPQQHALLQNFPNPFNSGTIIRFSLPTRERLEVSVFNTAGQKVVTLLAGERQPGEYTLAWDGRDESGKQLATGLYMYKFESDAYLETRKLLLLR